MGLKAGLQILQQTTKAVSRYTDDFVGFGVRNWTKPTSLEGLRYAPKLQGDVVLFSKRFFKSPSSDKLKILLRSNGLSKNQLFNKEGKKFFDDCLREDYINKNNDIFLEALLERFPLRTGCKVNTEVQRRMLYLENIDHSAYENKKVFLEKFLKDVDEIDSLQSLNGGKLYGTTLSNEYSKKAIIQAKYNNPVRYRELQDILKLYKDGKAPEHCLTFFPEGHFHELPKKDIKKLLRKENYYPKFTSISEIESTSLEVGEAFSIGEEMFVKTNAGFEKLKFDRRTYEKLFPPIERYSIAQGDAANCYKIATYNALIKQPESRINLYKTITQTSDGIQIDIPNCSYTYNFKWNDLKILNNSQNLQGGLGHKMIEYAYDINRYGKLMTTFPCRDTKEIIEAFTGKEARCFMRAPKDKHLRPQFFREHSNGIYIGNTATTDLNFGIADAHAASWFNLENGIRQNPWTGLEELNYGKPTALSGAWLDL